MIAAILFRLLATREARQEMESAIQYHGEKGIA